MRRTPNPRRHLPPLPVVDRSQLPFPRAGGRGPNSGPPQHLPDPHEPAQTGLPRSGQKHGGHDQDGLPGADVALHPERVSEAGMK